MALIPEQVLEEITAKTDIVDVVSSYVPLKKTGNRYTGLCPFHREKTPSFSVSADKQLFHCFGCGAGGTVIHFIMRAENLDFVEAVKFLAARANVIIPEQNDPNDSRRHQKRQLLYEINREAAKYYYKLLVADTNHVSAYLKKRRLTKQSVIKFGLGVAGHERDGLYRHLLSKKITAEQMEEAGLIMTGERGAVDKFRDRLMFPIFDVRGNIVGFGGRALGDIGPKYLNSPQTPIFDKSRNLYAFSLAKNSGAEYFLLAEGYMDVITLHQHGFDSAVASLGTAFTQGHAQLMKKYKKEVIICYDSDEAGIKATLRAIDILVLQGMDVRVLIQNRAKDPDEYLMKYGVDEFRVELERAMHHVDFKVLLLQKQYNLQNIDEKVKFLNGVARILKDIENLVEREVYINKIAEKYSVSREALLGEVEKQLQHHKEQSARRILYQQQKPRVLSANASALDQAEKTLLALLISNISLVGLLDESMKQGSFSNDTYQKVFHFILDRYEKNAAIDAALVINTFDAQDSSAITQICDSHLEFDDEQQAIAQLVDVITRQRLKQKFIETVKNAGELEKANKILQDYKRK
jgi:DNA primase